MQTDRHLLLGLLALQCGFITKDQLVSAFSLWTSDKSRSLEQILNENKAITAQQQSLLAALVEEHLKQHDNNPEKSLAALSSLPPITHELRQLADADLNASLAAVGPKEPDDPLATTESLKNPNSRSSRFIILRKHAKGGLGQVSVALDSELNRHVALKEMLAKCADDPASQQRFVQEAEITGQLEHPGIVPVYGLGTYGDGKPYYAMRFVEGDNLKRAVDQFHKERKPNEQLTGPRAVEFRNLLGRFVDVCNAIEYAHSRKVLHRDLKPDNILLGPYGETLVVDWGLAKALGKHDEPAEDVLIRPVKPRSGSYGETIEGSAIGTPAYMSPEQAEGKLQSLGPATDVYSLGATLYALLTGAPPVQGDTAVDTLEKVRRGDIERPRKLWTSVPKPLEAVCLKAMSLQPSNRYTSAKMLADEIEKWLADEPVSAVQEPMTARARRWIKRHPALASTTAAVTLLSLASALLFAYVQAAHADELKGKNKTITDQVVEVTKRREEAEKERTRAEEREQDAIAAVKRFGDAVANNPELKSNPKLESLRKELLKEPLGFFKSLRGRLQSERSTQKKSLARLATAAQELGKLTYQIGDKQDAIVAYEEAIKIFGQLAHENPLITEYAGGLAASQIGLGVFLIETGKPDEALEALEEARKTYERLSRENPTTTEYASNLALSRSNIGGMLRQSGNLTEALAAHEEAKKIREQLAHENPKVFQFASDLAASCANLSGLHLQTGKPAEALTALQEAKNIQERLTRENPSVYQFANDLALSNHNLGSLLRQTGKPVEALAAYKEAMKIRERLTRENPNVTEYVSNLALSYHNLGTLLYQIASPAEAFAAYEEAKKIQLRLTSENPTVTQYSSDLALIHHNLGILLHDTGKFAEALADYEKAKRIREELARKNPTIAEYASHLAASHNSIALLLHQTGKPVEALSAYEEAKRIQERLNSQNPTVADYASALARSHHNLANLLKKTGKPAEALAAYEEARKIFGRLAHENPTVTQYSHSLGASLNNIGTLFHEAGKPAEALAAFEEAKKIRERLVRENPAVSEFQSVLGGTLNNIAHLKLDAGAFIEAEQLLRLALECQKRALAVSPTNQAFREQLKNHYANLIRAAKGLMDDKLLVEAWKGYDELSASDPQFAELDQRLAAIAKGATANGAQELLALGERAYDTRRFALAARLFSKAMEEDATIAESRETQIPYNAACSAALAASGEGEGDPPLDDAAKTKLRSQALTWLKQELTQWQKFLGDDPKPEAKQTVAQTLAHWQQDSDLASIRDAEKLAALPEAARKEWEAHWAEVKALQAKVTPEPSTTPPADATAPPTTQSQPPPTTDPHK